MVRLFSFVDPARPTPVSSGEGLEGRLAALEFQTAEAARLIAELQLQLETEIAPDLPPVRADREKLSHVLGNLLGNAIHFTPEGGRVWIAARLQPLGSCRELLVEVGDSGIGIASEHHELVF